MLYIEHDQDFIYVRGRTRLLKYELQGLGGVWDFKDTKWVLPGTYDLGVLDTYLHAIYALKKKQEDAEYRETLIYARKFYLSGT